VFPLKPISKESIQLALEKAWRYRMLDEPMEAESICRDILAVEPEHLDARVTLVLALSDQLHARGNPSAFSEASALLKTLPDEYSRHYYGGILLERRAKALFQQGELGSGPAVYEDLREAMSSFERAEALRPQGNDEARLRWNACARMLNENRELRAASEERVQEMLE
jgi:hypothetical protein